MVSVRHASLFVIVFVCVCTVVVVVLLLIVVDSCEGPKMSQPIDNEAEQLAMRDLYKV